MQLVRVLAWLVCVVYSTIPSFWFMVHPRARGWRAGSYSPFRVLVPAWLTMWLGMGAITGPWRAVQLYRAPWPWIPAAAFFSIGIFLYARAGTHFSLAQLGGLPEVRSGHKDDRLITTGIRARLRHPVYLGHLCEMLAWSIGSGLLVCWLMTGFALLTGTAMIRMEDDELEERFGESYRDYRKSVPAALPRLTRR
ncbi:MAG TPA: isoprenylcysteine carboxylmethyltransferase family protein [Verrucomicrobiae bacterium]|nr:isoprenylcysteine carboxylmethyltransferase family protein [Verrucomicrobiae bacterium]